MKMKRILSAAAAVCAAVTVISIVGCGKKETVDNITNIEVWSSDTSSKLVYTTLIDKYNEGPGKAAGIKINYRVIDTEIYYQSVEQAFESGNSPDLFFAESLASMAEKGRIMPIENIPGMEELIEQRKPYMREFYNLYEGKIYCIPVSSRTMGLLYNKDMFKKAGIVDEKGEAKPPETWDEFRETAKKLTDRSRCEYGTVLPLKWSRWYDSDIDLTGMASMGIIKGYTPSTGTYDFSGYEPILNTFLGIKEDGSFLPGAETIDNDVARARFAEGGIGMKIGFSFDVGVLNDQFPAKIDWGVAPIPVIDKDYKYMQHNDIGSSFSVNKNTKVDLEKIATVLKFFSDDEFVIELYKNGAVVPYDSRLMEGVETVDSKKNWKEFCDLLKISALIPLSAPTGIDDEERIDSKFVNKVWTGEMTVKELVDSETKIYNEGMERYLSLHPEVDKSKYIDKNWNPVRQQ